MSRVEDALLLRDLVQKIVNDKLGKDRPGSTYATVTGFNPALGTVTVIYDGDTIEVDIPAGSIYPSEIGQVVKIGGPSGSRVVEDVMGENLTTVTARTAQESADGKNAVNYGDVPPPGTDHKDGDIWFNEGNSNMPNIWDGAQWKSIEDLRVSAIKDAQDEMRLELDNIVIGAGGMKTFYQPTMPLDTDDPAPAEGDLWFNTSVDGNNELHTFVSGAWVSAADARISVIKDAQTALEGDVTAAQSKADEAFQDAADADTKATTAQTKADVANDKASALLSAGASLVMNGDFENSSPNIWPNTSYQSGISVIEVPHARSGTHVMRLDSTSANRYPATEWFESTAGRIYYAEIWVYIDDVNMTQRGRISFYFQSRLEDGTEPGSYGRNIEDTAAVYVYQDELVQQQWNKVVAYITAPASTTHIRVAPHCLANETPYDFDDFKVVDVTESMGALREAWTASAAAATAKTTADNAQTAADNAQTAASNAQGTASSALTAANTKNRVTRSLSNPPAIYDGRVDDTWFVMSSLGANGRVLAQHKWSGTTWITETIGGEVIAYLDAAKISTGYLSTDRLAAGSITADKVLLGRSTNLIPSTEGTNKGFSAFEYDATEKALRAQGKQTYYSDIPFTLPAGEYRVDVEMKASVASTTYIGLYAPNAGWSGVAWRYALSNVSVGPTWGTYSGTVKVDAPTSVTLRILPAYTGEIGSGYTWYRNLTLRSMAGSTLIEGGAITTEKIAVGAITAESGVVASLDAGKISVGTLAAARLAANSITGDKLLIGGDRNFVANGDLTAGSTVGWPSAFVYQTTSAPPGFEAAADITGTSTAQWMDTKYSVFPGDVVVYEIWVKANKPNSRIYHEVRTQDGSNLADSANRWTSVQGGGPDASYIYPVANYVVPTVWTKLISKITVRAGVSSIYLRSFYPNHSAGTERTATISVTGIKLYRQVGATLIEDGAITTGKLAVGAITAESGVIGSLDASKITVGTLSGARLAADAINGKQIVGAQIVTSLTFPRVQLDSTGLSVYKSSSVRSFFADAATGNLSIVGDFATATDGNERVLLSNGLWNSIALIDENGTAIGSAAGSGIRIGKSLTEGMDLYHVGRTYSQGYVDLGAIVGPRFASGSSGSVLEMARTTNTVQGTLFNWGRLSARTDSGNMVAHVVVSGSVGGFAEVRSVNYVTVESIAADVNILGGDDVNITAAGDDVRLNAGNDVYLEPTRGAWINASEFFQTNIVDPPGTTGYSSRFWEEARFISTDVTGPLSHVESKSSATDGTFEVTTHDLSAGSYNRMGNFYVNNDEIRLESGKSTTGGRIVLSKTGQITFSAPSGFVGLPIATGDGVSFANCAANGGNDTKTINFPAGRFTSAPSVSAMTSQGRITPVVFNITATGFSFRVWNFTSASASAIVGTWMAVAAG